VAALEAQNVLEARAVFRIGLVRRTPGELHRRDDREALGPDRQIDIGM